MKRLIAALFFMAIGSADAVGLEKKNPAPAAAPKSLAAAPESASTIEMVPTEQLATAQFRLAPSVMMLIGPNGSATGIGGAGSVGLFTSGRSDVGLDFGYFQLSDSSVSLSMIPIQFSWVRRFAQGPVRPYIGLAAGATIFSASNSSRSETLIIPSLALRPGVEVSLTQSLGLFLEARGGLMLTLPFFNPQLGVALSL